MSASEAIEILKDIAYLRKPVEMQKHADALKLGINALKRQLFPQPLETEARAIIRYIKDAKRVHPDWTIDDVIDLLTFREETRQALKARRATSE